MESKTITQEQMQEVLDWAYDKAVDGSLPNQKSCSELAEEYMEKYNDKEVAAKKLIDMQIAKCTTSGFITGLGGLITLPVAIPANVGSVLYVQIRMIGSLAALGGYDLNSDEVKTLVYVTLAGLSISNIAKSAGIKISGKLVQGLIKKMPATVLTKINQKVGFRLITKFGSKGIVNLSEMIPVLGGVVGGAFDFVDTKVMANRALKLFILNVIEDDEDDDTDYTDITEEIEICDDENT